MGAWPAFLATLVLLGLEKIDVTAKDDSRQTRSSGSPAPAGSYGLHMFSAELPAAESLRPGMQLNGVYEIDALLARGGMGEVYKGHSIQTGDQVAIKVIRADLAENEVAIALFRNEASKLHRLHHEAIIRYFVFSVDPILQRTYLAMEFVEGEPLSQMLHRGPLPFEAVRRLAQRVALGLNAAHKRDIIHRDVSSDNIIIQNGDVDEAKIIDFGIARSTQVGTTLIDIGFAGKLNYVSPEQLGLYGGEVTCKSDIYSLGLVLLEALRGVPADMGGTQVEVIDKRKSVPSLAGVDRRAAPLLAKMLQPDPEDRQHSMQEVADAFARLPAGPPPESGTVLRPPAAARGAPGAPKAPARPARTPVASARRPLWFGAAAGGALALIIAAGGAYLWLSAPAKRIAPPEAVLQAPPEKPAPTPPAEPPAAPEPGPEPAPTPVVNARENALSFAARYSGGACFSIVSAAATGSSARIEGIGGSREAFDALNAAFQKAVGFEADVQGVLVPAAQCAAVDFYSAAKSGSGAAPQLKLDTPFLRAGQPLTGSISGAPDRRIEALLIGDDGLVQNVTGALPASRLRPFSLAAPRPKGGSDPQLLMLISSAEPLSSLKFAKPVKAAQLFPAIETEADQKQQQLGAAMAYFYVTD